jgi:endonuclease/exonuclease/phosphatase (EEP) superfamily protein YafD
VEHRLPPNQEEAFKRRAGRSGYRMFLESSLVGPAGDEKHRSAGVCILVRSNICCRLLQQPEASRAGAGRWIVVGIQLKGLEVNLVATYMETKIGMQGRNIRILQEIGEAIHQHGLLHLAVGDWNATPSRARQHRMVQEDFKQAGGKWPALHLHHRPKTRDRLLCRPR